MTSYIGLHNKNCVPPVSDNILLECLEPARLQFGVTDLSDEPCQLSLPFQTNEGIETPKLITRFNALKKYFSAIGLRDTEEVTQRVLDEFDSLLEFQSAPHARLFRTVGHNTAAIVSASRKLMMAALLERLDQRPIMKSSQYFIDYVLLRLAYAPQEYVLAFYLVSGLRLRHVAVIAKGSLLEASVRPRDIIARGLEVGATSLILVHNHPSGDAEPSKQDEAFTRKLKFLAADFEMPLLDHMIVARDGVTHVG